MSDKKWFLKYVEPNPSPLGLEVALFCGDLYGGFHNLWQHICDKNVDWTHDHHIVVPWPKGMATYDFNTLTRLVVMSHDRCLRVEVNPRHYNWLELVFHKRKRGGYLSERMPHLEEAIKAIRIVHPPTEHPNL